MSKKEKLDDKFISVSELDGQESLTIKRLQQINKKSNDVPKNRPSGSYIELINWVEENYKNHLAYKAPLNKLVHNNIIIDGQFVKFCEDTGTRVSSLLTDSIISWKSDFDNEKFFIQGVFLIQNKGIEFIHCALFHKGNQNEDEVSFCILVANEHLENYLQFRNDYTEWASKRDRSNLQIKVIDGNDIPYEKNAKWDDLFLPEQLKSDIKMSVDGFLKSEHIYKSKQIPWKRGLLFYGTPGCGKSTLIKTIISSYDFKPVTVLPGANDEMMMDAFAYAESQKPALLFFEDLDSLLQSINASLFLNLLDGISAKNGLLVIATANNLNALQNNIKDRPSRFDRKFEISIPDADMSEKYLRYWFKKSMDESFLKEISQYCIKYNFSYAYIKELYISSVYVAIGDNREDPTANDVKKAMEQLMADKFEKIKKIGVDKYHDTKKR